MRHKKPMKRFSTGLSLTKIKFAAATHVPVTSYKPPTSPTLVAACVVSQLPQIPEAPNEEEEEEGKEESKVVVEYRSLLTRRQPQLSRDIVGMEHQIGTFMRWIRQKISTRPRICLLSGPPGVGKTSTVQVIAKQENLAIVEINASENRSSQLLDKIIRESCCSARKDKRQRMLVLEELDGSFASSRGSCVDILLANIALYSKRENFPIIVATCNDPFKEVLRRLTPQNCLTISFPRISSLYMHRIIQRSIPDSNVKHITTETKNRIVEMAGGDARQALYALELHALAPTGASGVVPASADQDMNSIRDIVWNLFSRSPNMERHLTGSLIPATVQHNLARNVIAEPSVDTMDQLSAMIETISFAESLHHPRNFNGSNEEDSLSFIAGYAMHLGATLYCGALLGNNSHFQYSKPNFFTRRNPDYNAYKNNIDIF